MSGLDLSLIHISAEVSQADMEVTNVAKLIAVTKKYTRIDELTPEILKDVYKRQGQAGVYRKCPCPHH